MKAGTDRSDIGRTALVQRLGGQAGAIHRHAHCQPDLGIGTTHLDDLAGRVDLTGVAGTLQRQAHRRQGAHVLAKHLLVALQGLDVGQRVIAVALTRRQDRKTDMARQRRVSPDGCLERRAPVGWHIGCVVQHLEAGKVALQVQRGGVAVKLFAADFAGVEQRAHA